MTRILFFDDDPKRHNFFRWHNIGAKVDHARTPEEARALLRAHVYDIACLDHDMCMIEPAIDETGRDVVEFIAEHMDPTKRPRTVVIHSWNDSAAEAMASMLRLSGVPVVVMPHYC